MLKTTLISLFLLLATFVGAQDSIDEAQTDVSDLATLSSKEGKIFYKSLIKLLADLETNNCDLTPAERQNVISRLNSIVFGGREKSVEETAGLIVRFLNSEMERRNCVISEDDPAIKAFIADARDLIQRIHRLVGAVRDDLGL